MHQSHTETQILILTYLNQGKLLKWNIFIKKIWSGLCTSGSHTRFVASKLAMQREQTAQHWIHFLFSPPWHWVHIFVSSVKWQGTAKNAMVCSQSRVDVQLVLPTLWGGLGTTVVSALNTCFGLSPLAAEEEHLQCCVSTPEAIAASSICLLRSHSQKIGGKPGPPLYLCCCCTLQISRPYNTLFHGAEQPPSSPTILSHKQCKDSLHPLWLKPSPACSQVTFWMSSVDIWSNLHTQFDLIKVTEELTTALKKGSKTENKAHTTRVASFIFITGKSKLKKMITTDSSEQENWSQLITFSSYMVSSIP